MKIAVLGASGQTGLHLVQQALDANYDVIAIVRSLNKLNIKHERLSVVEGNIFSYEELKKCFQDVDIVMSALGFSLEQQPVTGYIEATKSITKAMKEVKCNRLIVMHSWYTGKTSRDDVPPFLKAFLSKIAPVLDNMREAEIYLETECGDINYTVVAPPGLANKEKTEGGFEVVDNQYSVPGDIRSINRADVARYMLAILCDASSYKKLQAISIKM